jgi:hypothetical protein
MNRLPATIRIVHNVDLEYQPWYKGYIHTMETEQNTNTNEKTTTNTEATEIKTEDSNEIVAETSLSQTAASPQSPQIDQGTQGTHPNQQMSPRIETLQGALAPAQMVHVTTTMPQYPPSESYKRMLDMKPNKSAKIRQMHSDGYTTSQISRHLGILYQHARNVLHQIVKRPTEQQQVITIIAPTTVVQLEALLRNLPTEEQAQLIERLKPTTQTTTTNTEAA